MTEYHADESAPSRQFPDNSENRALAKRIGMSRLEQSLYFPKYFEVETINACNAKCIMCTVREWPKRDQAIMPMELFAKFVSQIRDYSDWVETVCLNRDGEPTLDKQLPVRVKMLKQAGIRFVTLSTNAQRLSGDLAQELFKAGLDDIMVSIDGFSKAVFEKIRIGLDFEKVVGNTLRAIKVRDRVRPSARFRIRMVVLDENRFEVEDWLDFWNTRAGKQDKVYAMPAHSWGNQTQQEIPEKVNQFADKPCVSVFSTMTMHADGRVGFCGVDYEPKYPMGTFGPQTLKQIWNGQAYSLARQKHATGRRNAFSICRGCHLWDRQYQFAEE
jgi:sulfatase maturation enzyme AslB (radical SAM superfamily)